MVLLQVSCHIPACGTGKHQQGIEDQQTHAGNGQCHNQSDGHGKDYLWAQLEMADEINNNRLASWDRYYNALKPLADEGKIELQLHPEGCVHNAHMFYIKLHNLEERTAFIAHMKENDVLTVFHYVPLHSAPAGLKYGRFAGEDVYTTKESDRLVRLPLYYNLDEKDQQKVIDTILSFWKE